MPRYRKLKHRGPPRHRWAAVEGSWVRPFIPLVALFAEVGMDLAGDKRFIIITTVVISPLLAAALTGPWVTAAYAVAALLFGGLQAIPQGYYSGSGHEGPTAQAIRLVVIALGGMIAVAASRDRTRREARLRNVTRVADVAQRAILGTVPNQVAGLRLAVSYESAAAEASVGGDLYEVVESPWGTRILVGDARGKGLDAVRLASRVMGTFRVVANYLADPERVVAALDQEVTRTGGPEDFVTAVFAQVDGAHFDLINAGHPDPVLVRQGASRFLAGGERRAPLGLGARGSRSLRVPVEVGDRLLFYTDGLTEARHPRTREFFPLLAAVERSLTAPRLETGLERLVDRVREWTGSTLDDDVALLLTEVVIREPAGGDGTGTARPGPSDLFPTARHPSTV